MHRIRTTSVLGLTALALLFLVAPLVSQENDRPAYLRVWVPAGAELLVDGSKTKQTGSERLFESPPIPVGRKFIYTLKATWKEGGKDIVREMEVRVEAGRETPIDLRKPSAGKEKISTPKKEEPTADTAPPTKEARKPKREPDIFYLPTPQGVVDRMLELADLKKDDVVYDLGCGDGRIVVTAAAKFGVKATGFDIDPERVKDSLENVKKHNVEKLVTIKEADVFELDLRDASVVTLYLLPELNERLMPQLAKLKPGSRILSHDFPMDGAKPKKVERLKVKNDRGEESEHTIYMWIVPWEMEK
jgi:uncharacterized protein (TIGR03000 family)